MKKTLLLLCISLLIATGCKKDNDSVVPENNPNSSETYYFSVSDSVRVVFSNGNLQYQAASDTYRFAPNQSDLIGSLNDNVSCTYDGWIDLFGWGTGNNPTMTSLSYEDYPSFDDWGKYMDGGWRTLSKQEWDYLLEERVDCYTKRGAATVRGVHGMILLPDNWKGQSIIAEFDGFTTNYFSEEDWKTMEINGAIFLPAAGYRYQYTEKVGVLGNYWSCTPFVHSEEGAYGLRFGKDFVETSGFTRVNGRSVRLVKNFYK